MPPHLPTRAVVGPARRPALGALLLLGAAACGSSLGTPGDRTGPSAPALPGTHPASLVPASPVVQLAAADSVAPMGAAVGAVDVTGARIPDAVVHFRALGARDTSDVVQMTDAQGVARLHSWRIGPEPGRYVLEASIAALRPVRFVAHALPPAVRRSEAMARCPVPAELLPDVAPLRRSGARLAARQGLRVVAIGSSTTAGTGASSLELAYPARLAATLAAAYPGAVVLNKGVGGQLATQMLARFPTDVYPHAPHLVLWQTGTNDALGTEVGAEEFRATLDLGVQALQARGIDVMLVEPQLFAGPGETPRYRTFRGIVSEVADERRAALVPRYVWSEWLVRSGTYPLPALLAADQFHPSDLGHACTAHYAAVALAMAADTTAR